jgi:hypothetical protein
VETNSSFENIKVQKDDKIATDTPSVGTSTYGINYTDFTDFLSTEDIEDLREFSLFCSFCLR